VETQAVAWVCSLRAEALSGDALNFLNFAPVQELDVRMLTVDAIQRELDDTWLRAMNNQHNDVLF